VNVFLAGRDRQLMPEGRLTLHRRAPATLNPLWRAWSRQQEARQWQQAGLPQHLVRKALSATPAQPWHPEMDELVAAGLAGVPGRPLDVALPEGNAPASEWQDACAATQSGWRWNGLPGMLAAAVEPLPNRARCRQPTPPLQILAQQTLQARLPAAARSQHRAARALHRSAEPTDWPRWARLAETRRRMLAGDLGSCELPCRFACAKPRGYSTWRTTPPADLARCSTRW
jgi:hypothetical protein